MNTLKIAAVSCESIVGETDKNLEKIESYTEKASEKGADIVCFPELSITGYMLSETIYAYSEEIPGRITDILEQMASKHDICILAGLAENTGRGHAITHIVVTPTGYKGRYRKVHLSPKEKEFFLPGVEKPVFIYKEFNFGIGLCYDAHFPELSTIYSLKGADILFFPHASPPPESPKEKRDRWLRYLPARAYDNSVYVAACNQAGTNGRGMDFKGVTIVLGPKGEIISEEFGDDESMVIAEVDRSELKKVRTSAMGFFLKERVPRQYGDLIGQYKEEKEIVY